MDRKYRCLALFSGGLDSMLTVLLMHQLGYEVIPVFFKTPFFGSANAEKAARHIGFELLVIDITKEHIEMLKNPRYGFGKNMNPCIDCHGLMLKKAAELIPEYKIDFIISGEVLGQRPMSQRADALNAVAKLSGIKDLLVRPLCQKLLPDTKPIREGWVNKEEMLDISGRGRYRQMELAERYKITYYQNPGGGCLLTDMGYSRRLKDLMDNDMFEEKFIRFLEVGRHFRLNSSLKLIVGRNNNDNNKLSTLATTETVLQTADFPGPLAVINSKANPQENEIHWAASLLLRYNNKIIETAKVRYGENFNLVNVLSETKMNSQEVEEYII